MGQRMREVIVRCPADGEEQETWLKGEVTAVPLGLAWKPGCHVIRVTAFKWEEHELWGEYTGIPFIVAKETPSGPWLWEDRYE